jgi:23S rRNA pseudouridine2605 synthase
VYLSKFLSTHGACSRRKSTDAIKAELVTVNGEIVKEPFYMVQPGDKVALDGKNIKPIQNLVYILFNKPEDCISTVTDEQGRRSIFDIVKVKSDTRLYPVGRLDRNTTGLILLTNDGELTNKLMHPKHEVVKKYNVELDRPLLKVDFDRLINGVHLEDGFIKPDELFFDHGKPGKKVIIQLHSGRNRIVRRMFEYFRYNITKLDRFYLGGLSKKGLKIGEWRSLTNKEIEELKNK